jgi:hypothetical protein
MRKSVSFVGGFCLLAVGYVLGASQILSPVALFAQADRPENAAGAPDQPNISEETRAKIKTAADALKAAMDALTEEQQYSSATQGMNAFAILSGGNNSLKDLKAGAVVDPETFAALYSGLAVDSVAADLGRDPDGRLTYKGTLIRMYPLVQLKSVYARRAVITGEDITPIKSDAAAKKPAASESEQ